MLYKAASSLPGVHLRKGSLKKLCTQVLLADYLNHRSILARSTFDALHDKLNKVALASGSQQSILSLVSVFFEERYGSDVAYALRRPLPSVYAADEPPQSLLPWTCAPSQNLIDTLCDVPLDIIVHCIRKLTSSRPTFSARARRKTCSGLIKHILDRTRCLICMGHDFICDLIVAYFPFNYDSNLSEEEKITRILKHEYDADIINRLMSVSLNVPLPKAVQLANSRREKKMTRVQDEKNEQIAYDQEWPSVVPKQTVFACLHRYYEGTKWSDPPVCAVCAQSRADAIDFDPRAHLDVDLQCLFLTDEFIIRKCCSIIVYAVLFRESCLRWPHA